MPLRGRGLPAKDPSPAITRSSLRASPPEVPRPATRKGCPHWPITAASHKAPHAINSTVPVVSIDSAD